MAGWELAPRLRAPDSGRQCFQDVFLTEMVSKTFADFCRSSYSKSRLNWYDHARAKPSICHHPRKPGRLCRRHALAKTQSQSIGDRSPGDSRLRDFIKDSLNTFIKGGLVSLLMITGALVFRSAGESVTTKTPCPTRSAGRRMHHRVGESPDPGLTLLAIGHSIRGHAVAVIFRLHRPASRRHGCLTRRRDKHYQPNEGKAASMVFTARFGAGTLPALWVYASQTSRAG